MYAETHSDYDNDDNGDLKPAAANEDIDSDYDEDGDLKSTSIASNVESDSDYDNDDNEDLKTGGDDDEDLTTGGNLKTGGDLLEKPTAKIIKKKVPGGAFSPCRSPDSHHGQTFTESGSQETTTPPIM